MVNDPSPTDSRVLLIAPTPRDAQLSQSLLDDAGITCVVCENFTQLCKELGDGAGALLLTQEALHLPDTVLLVRAVESEAEWSDLPTIILCEQGEDSRSAPWALARLGNVTILERPVRVMTLISTLRSAIRARFRQYQVRDQLARLRKSSEELRESDNRFRNIANSAPAMLWITGVDHAAEFLSRSWHEYTGQSEPQSRGWGWLSAVYEGDRTRTRDIFINAATARSPFQLDLRIYRADGTVRWAMAAGRPRFDAHKEFLGYVGSVVEIHERKQVEEALRTSQERQALLLRLLQQQRVARDPGAMMSGAAEAVGRRLNAHRAGFFRQQDANQVQFLAGWSDPSLQPIDGVCPEDGIGKKYLDSLRKGRTLAVSNYDEDDADSKSRFTELGACAIICAPILRYGEWVAGLYVNHSKPRDWLAEEVALVREVADLTWDAVVRAESMRARLDSEERLQLAKSAAGLGIYDYDVANNIIEWDERLRTYWGVEPNEEISYQTFLAGLHPDDHKHTAEAVETSMDPKGDGKYFAEYRVINRQDARITWISALGRVTFEKNKPIRLIGTVQDISERKALEELRDALLRSEREARSEAERAVRAKDEFLALITHELRSPLATILGWLRLLEQGAVPTEEYADIARTILRSGEQLEQLINDLMDMS
ncbi:MAG: PAS domain S-box protein, partial [Phycisphaerae bacterium]